MNPRPLKMRLLGLLPRRWVITSAGARSRTLYLTFDDGPHPEHTPALLDLLARHEARASFFAIGREAAAHPQLVRRIVDEGHLLGNHSQTHPRFGRLSLAGQLDEVARADAVLAPFDGRDRHAFRPPRGEMGWRMLWHCIRRRVPVAFWSYDSLDYARGDADALLATARRHPPQPGDVILMHDDGPLSLAYLQAMLPAWRAEGYRFEALPVRG